MEDISKNIDLGQFGGQPGVGTVHSTHDSVSTGQSSKASGHTHRQVSCDYDRY